MSTLISVKLTLQSDTSPTLQDHGYVMCLFTRQLLLGTPLIYPQRDGWVNLVSGSSITKLHAKVTGYWMSTKMS